MNVTHYGCCKFLQFTAAFLKLSPIGRPIYANTYGCSGKTLLNFVDGSKISTHTFINIHRSTNIR